MGSAVEGLLLRVVVVVDVAVAVFAVTPDEVGSQW